ncbi:MAG TPA: hypothetical protein VN442_18170 [Bryobacteraceae bacterium]|nr:hypothetical protein [Bryobacteraceae bacterium]
MRFRSQFPAAFPVVLGILFFLAGSAFVPLLGIQNDEVFFAGGMYQPYEYRYGIRLFGERVPLMLLSYLGATKTWFYAALFSIWPESLESLRWPMLAAGAVVIWLFFLLLRRVGGLRAAMAGAALLAADALFLLVTLWGPAMFYHLFLVAALLLFVEYQRTQRRWALAGAFFCLGLGMWDKALFLWALGGMSLAALAAFPRLVWRAVTPRNAAAAAVAFSLGALPLLLFNVASRGETLRGNSSFTLSELNTKARQLHASLDGSMLFDWMVSPPDPAYARQPSAAIERASLRLAEESGNPQRSIAPLAYLLALLLLPFLWRSPARAPAVFALVFIAVAWFQMAITRNAGGAAHHTILLWPMPQLFAAVVFAEASRRIGKAGIPVLAVVVLLVAGSNALVLNQYFARAVRYGPGTNFTDAVFPMAKVVAASRARQIVLTDWGMTDSLRLLGGGTLPLLIATDPLRNPSPGEKEWQLVRNWISDPRHIFVGHTEAAEFQPGSRARLRKMAGELGYTPDGLEIIKDECGRPVYEVFRFKPACLER